MTLPHPTQPPNNSAASAEVTAAVSSELEEELSNFRREWLAEAQRKPKPVPVPVTISSPVDEPKPMPPPRSSPPAVKHGKLSSSPPKHNNHNQRFSAGIESHLEGLTLADDTPEPPARPKPRTALEIYDMAVTSEREGRLNDALSNYRHAFRLDPDVDRAYHRATAVPQKSLRGNEPRAPPVSTSAAGEFTFERTIQIAPDYAPDTEHRSVESVEKNMGVGSGHEDNTHPSSTTFLFDSLVRSIAAHPFQRPEASTMPSSPASDKNGTSAPEPISTEEALATLSFIPADPEAPLPLLRLPREIIGHILHIVALTSIIPPPRQARVEEATAQDGQVAPRKGKRTLKRKTLKEEMEAIEMDLELEDVDRAWQSDVEALERFARTCRAGRILSLDNSIWRSLCLRTYVPPHQIRKEEDATSIVALHGNDWRRCFIEHPRLRFDGCYISVVTYLRRGENHSWYAPSHLITFYRYLRFYASGLAISLLTTDAPGTVVRQLHPALRVKGLTFGRWRLRGEDVELWGLEDPSVEEDKRKYSFRIACRLKSTARGRMNKLEMVSMATEHRLTLEQTPLPIRPTKPFYFSKVASYAGELAEDQHRGQ